MGNVCVAYLGTDILEIKENFKADEANEANHYRYVDPLLKPNCLDKTAKYEVVITSQFETSKPQLPYRLVTCSSFEIKNYIKIMKTESKCS